MWPVVTDPPSHARPASASGPLADPELRLLDAYWRAANDLSVGQICLLDNPLVREPLRAEHVKPRLLGHWGTTLGTQLHLRAYEQGDQAARPRGHLRDPARPWRPVGDAPKPTDVGPEGIDETIEATQARSYQVFAGKLDYGRPGRIERLMVRAIHAPEGDFRDWEAIRGWARLIATELETA
jgi:hypothetical protein